MIKYSKNHGKTTGKLWNYYRDEPDNPPADKYDADPITNSASFKYKSSIIGKPLDNDIKEVEFVVPLEYLRNFWRTLDMPLINCKMNLILTLSKYCILTDITTQAAHPNADSSLVETRVSTNATLKIKILNCITSC